MTAATGKAEKSQKARGGAKKNTHCAQGREISYRRLGDLVKVGSNTAGGQETGEGRTEDQTELK